MSPLDVVCRIIWLLVVRWPGIIFYVSIYLAVPVQTRVVVGARRYFVLGAIASPCRWEKVSCSQKTRYQGQAVAAIIISLVTSRCASFRTRRLERAFDVSYLQL